MLGTETMPKKSRPPGRPKSQDSDSYRKQIGIRVKKDMADRLATVADSLGMDVSDLIRMVLIEKLSEYEARIRGHQT